MGNCIGMSLILKNKYQMQKDAEITTEYELYTIVDGADSIIIPQSTAVK